MHFIKGAGTNLVLAFLVFLLTSVFNSAQHGWEDGLMRRHTREQFFAPIKIAYFDENDVASLGGWPLPRNVYAFIAERLCQLGAKVVGFDVYWGPRTHAPDENDFALAAVLARRESICGSFYFDELGQIDSNVTRVISLEWPGPATHDALTATGMHAPGSELLQGPGRYGFANLIADDNGVLRRAPLFVRNGAVMYPSFARVLAQSYGHIFRDSTATQIKINYQVDARHLPLFPLREILNSPVDSARVAELHGSIVLVGIVSAQLGFARPTPIAPEMPVVAIHAQVLDNLLAHTALQPFPQWLWLIMLALLATLFAPVGKMKTPKLFRVGIALIVFGALVAVGLWRIHSVFPLYAYLFGVVLFLVSNLVVRARHQRHALVDEAAKREALEKKFHATVQAATAAQAETAQARQRHQKEIMRLRRELTTISPPPLQLQTQTEFPEVIHDPRGPMAGILAELVRLAATRAPVLITGESGTGKEMIAHAIHQKSTRAAAPFLAVNCAALPESLLESELFGHEKGAFTGALATKTGLFEAAHHGTIFLDEIAAMPLLFQAKLLRVLQNGEFFRVGTTQMRTVDVRVIAAANRPLQDLLASGELREDLYFRLNVLPLHLPPLRERPTDISLLLAHFLKGAECTISEEALRLLQEYAWPGNVRELQNLAERMRVIGGKAMLSSEWVRQQLSFPLSNFPAEALDAHILRLYRELEFRNDSNTQIAAALGYLHRSTVTEYLKGMTFLYFAQAKFHLEVALRCFNPQPEATRDARLKSRMLKYLHNLREDVDPQQSWQNNSARVMERMRKMPQRYHTAALECAKACWQGKWELG